MIMFLKSCMELRSFVFGISVTCLVSVVSADNLTEPAVGTAITPLKVFAATGENAGKDVDYAAERGAKPTVYIFIQHERFDRPLARLLKALEKAAIDAGHEASLVTVFLTDDETKTRDHLPRIQTSLQFTANPLVVFKSSTMGPDGWSVNTDNQLTAIVVKGGKVAAAFGYRSANETVAPEIATALKKATE